MNKDRAIVFEFLEQLVQNNSKDWMDEHRNWYHEARQVVIDTFEPILAEIKLHDPRIVQSDARKSLNRINNNLMFHPDRPTYKDHFGVGFGYGKGLADFYIHVGLDEMMIAGGLWHPPTDKLKLLRQEIDYEGERLSSILQEEAFKIDFELYQEDKLKGSPKGYTVDHPHIELLRMKSLAAFRPIDRKDFYSDNFGEIVVDSYLTLLPFLDFINEAIQESF